MAGLAGIERPLGPIQGFKWTSLREYQRQCEENKGSLRRDARWEWAFRRRKGCGKTVPNFIRGCTGLLCRRVSPQLVVIESLARVELALE